jgi:hypothetical protein
MQSVAAALVVRPTTMVAITTGSNPSRRWATTIITRPTSDVGPVRTTGR